MPPPLSSWGLLLASGKPIPIQIFETLQVKGAVQLPSVFLPGPLTGTYIKTVHEIRL